MTRARRTRAAVAARRSAVAAPAIDWSVLARHAEEMRTRAYAPYSNYHVGAALLARVGPRGAPQLFVGANVENASYPLCLCAERVAMATAAQVGARELVAIAVATRGPIAGSPCGMCRQVLAEFGKPEVPVALVVGGKIVERATLGELLPRAFDGARLKQGTAPGAKRGAARSRA